MENTENLNNHVLVIDDDENSTVPLIKKLKDGGLQVSYARDGQEGLDKSLAEHPDLILLDITMPVMDGMEMLAKLREDSWGRQAKVIILTNLDFNIKASESFNLGVYEYLVKTNWNLGDIVGKVKEKLGEFGKSHI